MSTRKTFQTYVPTETHEIEINGQVFPINPSVPGDVILDFLSGADAENPSTMAKTIRDLFDAAIVEDQLETWHTFIRDPANNVTLDVLSEVAGYLTEILSGNDQQQSVMSSAG